MEYRTKLDLSDNRQVKQRQQTTFDLLGRTNFGVPYSGLTSGADYGTSATTEVFQNVVSSFSGNLSSTSFNFGLPQMIGSEVYLDVITNTNSNVIQTVDPYFIGVNPHINPIMGNLVHTFYSGTSYDFEITEFSEYSPNLFSGKAISELVVLYSANTSDYDGDGVWLKVNGKSETEEIAIKKNATPNSILTCLNYSGQTDWTSVSSITSGFTSSLFIPGSGSNSLKTIYSIRDASGGKSISIGDGLASGNYSFCLGVESIASGDFSFAGGGVSGNMGSAGATASGFGSFVYSTGLNSNSRAFSDYSAILGGTDHLLNSSATNSVILGGSNKVGNESNTVYVPKLNIGTISSGASVSDIGINAQGFVVDVLSDERLKENIKPIENALETVLKLNGVSYNWKDRVNGGDELRIGLIAQEVLEVVPELTFKGSNDHYGVHYGNITALLIEAIKELTNTKKNILNQNLIPKSTSDEIGDIGDVVCNSDFLFIKTEQGWKKNKLQTF